MNEVSRAERRQVSINLVSVQSGDLGVGEDLLAKGDWGEALATFQFALDRGKCTPEAKANLGLALIKSGHIEEGIGHCRSAIASDPLLAAGHLHLALGLLMQQESRDAERACLDAQRLLPSEEGSEILAVLACYHEGLEKAERLYGELIERAPDYDCAYGIRSVLRCLSGRVANAVGDAQRAVDVNREHGSRFRPLGLDEVQADVLAFLAARLAPLARAQVPDTLYSVALARLGELLLRKDRLAESVAILEAAKRHDESDGAVAAALDEARKEEGKFNWSLGESYRALDLDPTRTDARSMIAELHYEQALATENRRVRLGILPSPRAHMTDRHVFKINDIAVFFTDDLDGGGMGVLPDYAQYIVDNVGRRRRIFEWCAGPGFLGFGMLSAGLCETLCLADISRKAVDMANHTVKMNRLEDRVSVYHSDCLDDIPESEKWDLIISNPPHNGGDKEVRFNKVHDIDRRGRDRGWEIHRRFYEKVRRHLTDDGILVILEWSDPDNGSTAETFRAMIEGNGLKIVSAEDCRSYRNHYYLWSAPA